MPQRRPPQVTAATLTSVEGKEPRLVEHGDELPEGSDAMFGAVPKHF
jgi:hypothetical protein